MNCLSIVASAALGLAFTSALVCQDPAAAQGGIPDCAEMQKTESGLEWGILKKGSDGLRPVDGDTVEVHYTGWLTDGTKFDSSRDRGAPSKFGVNQVIKGWTEGLKLMTPGMRCKFVIPGDLAYGPSGRPGTIPPNATLVFDVELLNVIRMPKYVAPDPSKQQEITEGLGKGIRYEVVKPGTGAMWSEGKGVAMRYAFWAKDGERLLDCSEKSGQKLGGTIDSLPVEFVQVFVKLCKVGEVVRAEVPQQVWQRGGGTTVWELEMLSVNDVPKHRALDGEKTVTTDSGLKYEVIAQGEGDSPAAVDTVEAYYTGWLTDGTLFDSAHARGEPSAFPLNRVIPGWTEGLQLMKPGGKFLFEIPSELAYGARATGKIPANSTLIFLVELVSVKKG